MPIFTPDDLARHSLDELRGLYRRMFNELVQAAPDSDARRDADASLKAIQSEIARRWPKP
ncbi:MAG: hypothetical protein H6843_13900 [Rhodospirillaceae bacterium]|nr:hypothetical protein [Rhodospirillaceae bacterium]